MNSKIHFQCRGQDVESLSEQITSKRRKLKNPYVDENAVIRAIKRKEGDRKVLKDKYKNNISKGNSSVIKTTQNERNGCYWK